MVTSIRYSQRQKTGKPNNFKKNVGARKSKALNWIVNIG